MNTEQSLSAAAPSSDGDSSSSDREMFTVTVNHPDGSTSPMHIARGFDDAVETHHTPDDESMPLAVLVFPGLAVGARYYFPLVRQLAAYGIDTAVTELRGQGESTYRVGRKSPPAGYHEGAAHDYPAALDALEKGLGPRRVVILGHSMGAQIGIYHLARRDPRVVGLIGVATQLPYYRRYPPLMSLRLRWGATLLTWIGKTTGSVPARFLGGTGNQPASRMQDWGRLVTRGTLQPKRADMDYLAALREVTTPILLIVIDGDEQAPLTANELLLELVPAARTSIQVEPTQLGHNRWARTPEHVAERVRDWIASEIA